jgi:hypothetical protein
MKFEITKCAGRILRTLYDPKTGQRYKSNLRHGLHSSAQSLVRKGWITKEKHGLYRPVYQITDAGIPFAQKAWEGVER